MLPFENLSGDKEQDYFADGITADDLTTDLSRLPDSFVISRGNAFTGLHKLMPGFTVQDWANIKWSDNPQFSAANTPRRSSKACARPGYQRAWGRRIEPAARGR